MHVYICIYLDVYKAFSIDEDPGFSVGVILLPGDTWRCLETRREVRTGGERLSASMNGAGEAAPHPAAHSCLRGRRPQISSS